MNKLVICFGIIMCLCISSVSAQLMISPNQQSLSVFKGVPFVGSVQLFNNNSFSAYNVSFSSVQDVTFPSNIVLAPNEFRNVSFVVSSNSLYSFSRVSVVSFLYSDVSSCNLSARSVNVNVSDSGFSPSVINLRVNDSILFSNVGTQVFDISDLNALSTIGSLSIGGQFSKVFDGAGNFSFFKSPGGQTFSVVVLNDSVDCFVHSSSFDVPFVFSVSSSLSPSTLQFVNLLPGNFSSNNNQTQFGVLEVKNFDNLPLHNVVLSDSRGWVRFSVNNFSLSGLENRLVPFNLTPLVSRTVDTNVSLPLQFFASSFNGGNGSIFSSVFVNYALLDSFSVNGTTYVINRLSINDSIAFCKLNPDDLECLAMVDAFKTNVTVVQEVQATHKVSEDRWLEIDSKINQAFAGQDRVINSADRLITYVQNDSLPLWNSLAEKIKDIDEKTSQDDALILKLIDDGNKRFNFYLMLAGAILVFNVVVYFVKLFAEFNFRKRTGQW